MIKAPPAAFVLACLLGLAVSGSVASAEDPPPDSGEAGDLKEGRSASLRACASCHGVDGNSEDPATPKLAGQPASWLIKQMLDIRAGARLVSEGDCAKAARNEREVRGLGAWFSTARATAETPDAALAQQGADLFRFGDPAAGIVACSSCHNRRGEGYDVGIPGGIPALRAQHTVYAEAAMVAYREGTRNNDWNGVMQNVARRLNDEQIASLAAYGASLE